MPPRGKWKSNSLHPYECDDEKTLLPSVASLQIFGQGNAVMESEKCNLCLRHSICQ